MEAQLAEKDPEAIGLDAIGRRLLSQNRAMAKELELHIEVQMLIKFLPCIQECVQYSSCHCFWLQSSPMTSLDQGRQNAPRQVYSQIGCSEINVLLRAKYPCSTNASPIGSRDFQYDSAGGRSFAGRSEIASS